LESRIYFLLFFIFILGTACHSNKKLIHSPPLSFQQKISQSSVFKSGFTGVHILNLSNQEILFEQNAHKYFTAASNIKILTLDICTDILSDSIPAMEYLIYQDSLIFWGTGDPTFLNKNFPKDAKLLHFLKKQKEHLLFFSGNYEDVPFGPGWAWDDYAYGFQTERSPFPIYGNQVNFEKTKLDTFYTITPSLFYNQLHHNTLLNKGARITRQKGENKFEYNKFTAKGQSYNRNLPFKYSDDLFTQLMSDQVGRTIKLYNEKKLPIGSRRKIYSVSSDLLYKRMMQESDNFVAEQLLLIASGILTDTLSTRKTIEYAKHNVFPSLPDQPMMRDGSGLSRYNLLTPRVIVASLQNLYKKIPERKLLEWFPLAGASGTIKHWYPKDDVHFLYGKTGSMSNIYCFSGYLITKRGKRIAFSFMHNNFVGSSRPYQQEMQKILKQIYLDY